MSAEHRLSNAIFWRESAPLVLGSGSQTRRTLLEACAIPVRVLKPDTDEGSLATRLLAEQAPPKAIAQALAMAKSAAVAQQAPDALVLAADQTLDHHGALFMKPAGIEQARAQLKRLRADTHELHSAAVLRRGERILWQGVSSARLVMRDFSDAFLDGYIGATGVTLLETVGGYQIEGAGLHLFAEVRGEHAAILGLPLTQILEALRNIGALAR